MSETYNIDSESDDDEEEETELPQPIAKNATWHLHDIEKLKEQTNELLDTKWKETRNKHLLRKMLELEQPAITVKMVDFLLQDGVCEALVSFITQVGNNSPRPGPNDPHSDALKLSYRAVVLLSPENPTDALNAFLSKKAAVVARTIFDIFRKDSAGSFYHAYRILEVLLRCFPADVYEGICSDGLVTERMQNLLSHVGYAPICELAVMLVALTPVARTSQLYVISCKARWSFFEEMSQWNLMYRITKVMVNPEEHCVHDAYITIDQHVSAASQLLQELVEKLSLEDTGEILLQPFGYTLQLLDALIDTSISPTAEDGLRRCCTRFICFLLRRAAEAEIMCFVNNPQANNGNAPVPPTATYIPNRLYPLRARVVNHIRERIGDITNSITSFEAESLATADAIKYSSYEVSKPFSSLRSFIVEVLVLMVESDETVASLISVELWKMLISWAIKYAYNNIYHALFYRLIFAVLRQGQEGPQKVLFQKAKFALFLIDNFVQYQLDGTYSLPPKGTPEYDLYSRRVAARGLIMNCANAIRLQVSCQPPTSFLATFLSTHVKWNEFLPQLTIGTDIQLKFGMGINIASMEATASRMSNMLMYISEPKPDSAMVDEVDHGSRFAKSLGFYEEAQWSFSAPEPPPVDPALAEARKKRREKRRKSEDIDDGRLSFEEEHIDGRLSDSSDSEEIAAHIANNIPSSPTKGENSVLIENEVPGDASH